MRRVLHFLLMEIGLITLVSYSSSSSTAAFITATKRYKQNDDWIQSKKLYSETSSHGNVVQLQKRFNFTKEWTKKPSSMKLTTLNHSIVNSRIDWLKERLNLSEDDVGKIIKMQPQILQLRSDENVGPTLDCLTDQLLLKPKELSNFVKNQPAILCSRLKKIQPNLNWIESRVVTNKQSSAKSLSQKKNIVKKIIYNAPQILHLDIDTNLEPKWKTMQKRLDLNETQLAKITIKNPKWLQRNFISSIEPKLNWLQNNLDLDSNELRKIIQKQPTLLALSIEDTFEPKLSWMKERLFLDESTVKKVILWQPNILYYSTTTRMEPILCWLEQHFSLKDHSQIIKIISKFPHIFGMSIENNIEPTFQFFCDCIGKEEAVIMLQNYPMYLGVSLDKRLNPRREQAQQVGIVVDVGCVQRMVMYTEESWHRSLVYQQRKLLLN